MAKYRVTSALVGVIHGSHQQFVRPDKITADENQVNMLHEKTRNLNVITGKAILDTGIASMTTDSSHKANVRGQWDTERSFGTIIVENIEAPTPELYMISFFADKNALIGKNPAPDAIIHLNTSNRIRVESGGIRGLQTDIIQRMASSGASSQILPNTIGSNLLTIGEAGDDMARIAINPEIISKSSSLADISNLNGANSVAKTLTILDETTAHLMEGSLSKRIGGDDAKNAIAESATTMCRETQTEDNDLISFILTGRTATDTSMSIALEELHGLLKYFEFQVVTTNVGNKNFMQTARMDTTYGAISQTLANDIIALMIDKNVLNLRFKATNRSGSLEFVTPPDWFVPINLGAIKGMNMEAMRNSELTKENAIASIIKNKILPRAMTLGSTDIVIDINLITTTSVRMEINGERQNHEIPTCMSSAWANTNISDVDMMANGKSQRTLLNSILEKNQSLQGEGNHNHRK